MSQHSYLERFYAREARVPRAYPDCCPYHASGGRNPAYGSHEHSYPAHGTQDHARAVAAHEVRCTTCEAQATDSFLGSLRPAEDART